MTEKREKDKQAKAKAKAKAKEVKDMLKKTRNDLKDVRQKLRNEKEAFRQFKLRNKESKPSKLWEAACAYVDTRMREEKKDEAFELWRAQYSNDSLYRTMQKAEGVHTGRTARPLPDKHSICLCLCLCLSEVFV